MSLLCCIRTLSLMRYLMNRYRERTGSEIPKVDLFKAIYVLQVKEYYQKGWELRQTTENERQKDNWYELAKEDIHDINFLYITGGTRSDMEKIVIDWMEKYRRRIR